MSTLYFLVFFRQISSLFVWPRLFHCVLFHRWLSNYFFSNHSFYAFKYRERDRHTETEIETETQTETSNVSTEENRHWRSRPHKQRGRIRDREIQKVWHRVKQRVTASQASILGGFGGRDPPDFGLGGRGGRSASRRGVVNGSRKTLYSLLCTESTLESVFFRLFYNKERKIS